MLWREEAHKHLRREGCLARTLQHVFGDAPFLGMKLKYALFDRLRGDKAINRDRILLSDAMDAVRRLILNGRVPPGIEQAS